MIVFFDVVDVGIDGDYVVYVFMVGNEWWIGFYWLVVIYCV